MTLIGVVQPRNETRWWCLGAFSFHNIIIHQHCSEMKHQETSKHLYNAHPTP